MNPAQVLADLGFTFRGSGTASFRCMLIVSAALFPRKVLAGEQVIERRAERIEVGADVHVPCRRDLLGDIVGVQTAGPPASGGHPRRPLFARRDALLLLTGKHPYEGKSAAETMSMHLKEAVPDPRKVNPRSARDLAGSSRTDGKERTSATDAREMLEDLKRSRRDPRRVLRGQYQARVQLHQKPYDPPGRAEEDAIWPFVAAEACSRPARLP